MKLTDIQKQTIIGILDSTEFMSDLYEGLDAKTRDELGQFYTPAAVCIEMIELYKATDFSGKNILDPCCGSGNLLIAMLCVGADSDKLYGNDYDSRAVNLAKKRINRACDLLGKPHIRDWQIHQGNACQARCITEFSEGYDVNYNSDYIDDLDYAQGIDKNGRRLSWEEENDIMQEKYNPPEQLSLF